MMLLLADADRRSPAVQWLNPFFRGFFFGKRKCCQILPILT